MQIFNSGVIDYVWSIVKLEGRIKRVGINQKSDKYNSQQMDKRLAENTFIFSCYKCRH
jgi:hypothetical protein